MCGSSRFRRRRRGLPGATRRGAERCEPATRTCQPGTPPDLSDQVACTRDTCVEATPHEAAHVAHEPVDAGCDDADFCTGVETCHPLLDCQPGTPPQVDDDNDCTRDVCDTALASVLHEPVATGTACDGDEGTCDGAGRCVPCVTDGECSDGLACNGTEICSAQHECMSGPAVVTNDGIACTVDGCDEARGVFHLPDDAACDDGVPCTIDRCSTGTGCLNVLLPDGSACVQAGFASTCRDGLCGGCRPALSTLTEVRRATLNRVEEGCPTCPFELRARYETPRHYLRCVSDLLRALRRGRMITPRERSLLRRAARRVEMGEGS